MTRAASGAFGFEEPNLIFYPSIFGLRTQPEFLEAYVVGSLLHLVGYQQLISGTAAKMAGKMTLYKLVVLGDGGVGKTALTIQVYLIAQIHELKLTLLSFVSTTSLRPMTLQSRTRIENK